MNGLKIDKVLPQIVWWWWVGGSRCVVYVFEVFQACGCGEYISVCHR